MPYKFYEDYETMEDIDAEYRQPYRREKSVTGTGELRRRHAARMRELELKEYEFADQMEARTMSFSVDLRNKYQIQSAINTLTAALAALENETFEIPRSAYDQHGRKMPY